MPYEYVTAYRIESYLKIYQLIESIKFHINDITTLVLRTKFTSALQGLITLVFVFQHDPPQQGAGEPLAQKWEPPQQKWEPSAQQWEPPQQKWEPTEQKWEPPQQRWEPTEQKWEPPQEQRGRELTAMQQLLEMGFANRDLNRELLDQHNEDVEKVVQELLQRNDNDWHSNRHGQ